MSPRPSFFEPSTRDEIIARLRCLQPEDQGRWGRMTAPEMIAHLSDQMTHTLGHVPARLRKNFLRLPLMKYLSIYWIPWPRGLLKGPPEAYATRPEARGEDLEKLIGLVEELGTRDPEGDWPHHALFGSVSGQEWGVFCYKHFDHHLRQFGV